MKPYREMVADREYEFILVDQETDIPDWTNREALAFFFHENMKPYEDTMQDIQRGFDYAFSKDGGKGGFILLASHDRQLAGGLVMLKTGMQGYVPENLLLFISVRSDLRGLGIGRILSERAISLVQGNIKLHVEYDNPARHLYERLGFSNKYAEMRYIR